MSEQPPLTPPSGDAPTFEPYAAPAYGDVGAEEPGPLADPTLVVPSMPVAPAPAPPPLTSPAPPATGYAPPAPPGAPGPGAPGPGPWGSGAGWSPYPTTPQGAQPYQVAPQYAAFGAPTHPQATTSLVLGLIGLVGLIGTPFVLFSFLAVGCSPFAIWLGARARRQIRANPQAHSGDGVALAGLVTGIVGVVLGVLALIAIVAVIGLFVAVFSASA